jgi:uncharacterized protein (DUF305 family)
MTKLNKTLEELNMDLGYGDEPYMDIIETSDNKIVQYVPEQYENDGELMQGTGYYVEKNTTALNMTKLTGSKKQIAWANRLKEENIKKYQEDIKRREEKINTFSDEQKSKKFFQMIIKRNETMKKDLEWLKNEIDAAKIINYYQD